MLQKYKTKREEGFTIIEVLIVLAIAGLIILIVFLAVPALQRNSRNTQRKNDVAAVLSAVAEFSNNNNGQLPNDASIGWTNTNGTVTVKGATGTSSANARVAYYTNGVAAMNGNVNKVAAGTGTAADTMNKADKDYVIISTGTECSGNLSQAGPTRSVTAVYMIESGVNSYSQVCQQS